MNGNILYVYFFCYLLKMRFVGVELAVLLVPVTSYKRDKHETVLFPGLGLCYSYKSLKKSTLTFIFKFGSN